MSEPTEPEPLTDEDEIDSSPAEDPEPAAGLAHPVTTGHFQSPHDACYHRIERLEAEKAEAASDHLHAAMAAELHLTRLAEKNRGLRAERDAIAESARVVIAAWDAGWDCSRTPGHVGVNAAIGDLESALNQEEE